MKTQILNLRDDLKKVNSLLNRGWTFGYMINGDYVLLTKNIDRSRRNESELTSTNIGYNTRQFPY